MNYDFTNAIKTHMEENTQRIGVIKDFLRDSWSSSNAMYTAAVTGRRHGRGTVKKRIGFY